MDNDVNTTPEQAREQLEAASASGVTTSRDRALHAGGMVVFGLVIGASATLDQRIDGMAGSVTAVVLWGAALAMLLWVEREAKTTPLRAGRWARIGFGSSLVLNLALVTPWLNTQAKEGPVSWSVLALAALVIAVPSLIAAARIWMVRR